ncbi:Uncharacterized protein TCAP_03708 [Tolypocladium capitatum]|uniref:Uncharacterized protein n=1 Tax=Tolypocladium capitatum TaxID=45235 RepID=A0A2K3QFP4_9HYPO|nr:Uncharacterized protein TCAP_03708 [Tolypocladium capitatum]
MKPEESQKQRSQQDPEQLVESPPPYDFDEDPSLAQDSDSDADADALVTMAPGEKSRKFPHNMDIVFLPNAKAIDMAKVDWEARFFVHAKDMPRLMKQGFYWTEANLLLGVAGATVASIILQI